MEREYVISKGIKIRVENVMDEDIIISYRDPDRKINRPVYNLTQSNGEQKFKNKKSQQRIKYDNKLSKDWSIVNIYSKHILTNSFGKVFKKEFDDSYRVFTMLLNY